MLGTGIGVSATYIFLFVVFGAFLKHSGFSKFINDFSLTLVGQTPGGPAKVAVVASALMGMINGSAIANVATTGTITIPLMKRTGYRKEFAGAVEAVASTGGRLCYGGIFEPELYEGHAGGDHAGLPVLSGAVDVRAF